jgi:transaldolase
MNPLLELIEHGQSYWLDNLTRGKITSGELKRRVAEQGLRGVTSNPTIFEKAISKSRDYDEQIRRLVEHGASVPQIYEQVVIKDIQDACDILRPVYEDSSGVNGFVSLEVSPHLAHNAAETVAEAHRLFNTVARPNVMIKVPGTSGAVPAIEELLFGGVNVNITLLFSVESYEAVAWAYIRALERRAASNQPIKHIASVASFFLSRIDSLVDRLLTEKTPAEKIQAGAGPEGEKLLGKAAVANAKLAYQRFQRILAFDRWKALEQAGARVQRMLWASTSTKNPHYRDLMYVEPLIGPHTVNTMPDETIAAFADHGVVRDTVEEGVDEARQIIENLARLDIDFGAVTEQLLAEGIAKFIEPYEALFKTLMEKRERFLPTSVSG